MTSDSPVAKTTKKTAKKATQKKATQRAQTAKKAPAKKVTTKVESNPNIRSRTPAPPVSTEVAEVVDVVGSQLDRVIGEARARGIPALLGPCTVSLHFDVEDASTPLEAVVDVTNQLMRNGLSSFTWLVRDEITDEIYGVQDGRIIQLEEARVAPE